MKLILVWILFLIIIVSSYFVLTEPIQCIDENNNKVDWYVLYKIPHKKKGSDNKLIKNGFAYLYITSNNVTNWQLSNLSVNSTNSFLARTLEPLYDKQNNDNLMHILYNDEPPNRKESKKGHTKGIVFGNTNGGVWIVHSVPLFPPPSTETYSYPLTGTIYGQSVLCMSFDQKNLNNVGTQLIYNNPQVYSSNLPNNLSTVYPQIKNIIDHAIIDNAPWFHTLNLQTLNGTNFLSFAKNKNFNKDLYEDWVAPALNVSLLVETWLNGPGKLPSNCSKPFSVKNIEIINLEVASVSFKSALDHSKWAVANNSDIYWTCIGDINRAEHQKHRGGGTVCLNNPKIANIYRKTIGSIENCT